MRDRAGISTQEKIIEWKKKIKKKNIVEIMNQKEVLLIQKIEEKGNTILRWRK